MIKKVLAIMSLMVLTLALLVSNETERAIAASTWPITTDISPMGIRAIDANTAFLADCGDSYYQNRYGKMAFATLKSGRTTYSAGFAGGQGNSYMPQTFACANNEYVVSPNGTWYGTYTFDNNGDNRLVAEKAGNIIWSKKIDVCTSGNYTNGSVVSIVMGSDGKLYALIAGDGCSAFRLYEFSPVDGSPVGTAYTFPMTTTRNDFGNFKLSSYAGEVVVRDANSKYYYFTNGNTTTPALTTYTALTSSAYYYTSKWVDSSKNVYDFYGANADACPGGLKYKVKPRTSTAVVYTYSTDDNCQPYSTTAALLPGKAFAYVQNWTSRSNYGSSTMIVSKYSIPASGTALVRKDVLLTSPTGYKETTGSLFADINGNVLYVSMMQNDNTNAYDVIVRKIDFTNSTSSILWRASTSLSGASSYSRLNNMDYANGSLFMAICYDNQCEGNRSKARIQQVLLDGYGAQYLSSGSIAPAYATKKKYVALGDSYASGEGVNDYLYGTDIDASTNLCHRSRNSWPFKLEIDNTLNLDLTSFVACSGAITNNVAQGQYNEEAQLTALSPSTQVVTLSIGGNDIDFAGLITTCVKQTQYLCDYGLENKKTSDIYISVKARVQNLITNVIQRTSSTTKVYVIGYPNLFPDPSAVYGSCTWGNWAAGFIGATSSNPVTQLEISDMRSIHDQLNNALSSAKNQFGSNVIFVDPTSAFIGHEECTSDPYFNFIVYSNGADQAGSFHPNMSGVDAYYNVIKQKMP